MDLKAYLKSLPDEGVREAFAVRCGCTIGHLRNVSYGTRVCSPELAVALERESERAMTRQELCPTNWQRVWPELAGAEFAERRDAEAA